ncbi:histone H4 transcription factor-like [Macrosteles quadrilineatus]|uniref:histone H4 transcription factor-like n=1 Tax=Macrosteles quadrilineatus TaxID=74068 RepID=UPI0023E225E4|nr:histone H4 transcription factor-like [Macrosteles quadrilineatus]XP_054289818.1 histone H4 transcription factor-like [Macrosteles quadrilineatus]
MSNEEDSKSSSKSSASGKSLDRRKKDGYKESHSKEIENNLNNYKMEYEDDDDRSPMEWSDDDDSILNHLNKAATLQTAKRKRSVGPFELNFNCEWKGCSFETSEDSKFHVHVSYHIPDVEVKTMGNGDEVYVCLWAECSYMTGEAKEIQRHVTYHSYHTKLKNIGEKIAQEWKLPKCLYGTETRNLIPDKIDGMVCEWKDCSKEFNNVQLFLYHIHMHVNESFMTSDSKREKFSCKWKGCSRSNMPTRVRLMDHMRTHTRERVAACPTCGHVFSTNTKLSDHCHRQMTNEGSDFPCSHCYKNFPSLRLLKDHMRGHVNFYKCCYCDMTCFSRHTFSAHIRYKHLDSKPFKCSMCKYACKTQYDLKTHLTSHDPDARLGCEEEGCEFSCRSKQTLQRHMIDHHQVTAASIYCCHLCESKFKRGCYLTKHLMTKHCLRWPSGHSRFMYQRQEDGNFRLQTVRYESVKLYGENSQKSAASPSKNESKSSSLSTLNGSASFKVSNIESDSNSGVSQVFISIEDESGKTINCVTAPEVVGDQIPKFATVIASAMETDTDDTGDEVKNSY